MLNQVILIVAVPIYGELEVPPGGAQSIDRANPNDTLLLSQRSTVGLAIRSLLVDRNVLITKEWK